MKVLATQLFLTLCDPMNCSTPGSSVHGILRQEYWSGLPCPGDLPDPGIEPVSLIFPALADRFFTTSDIWEIPFAISGTYLSELICATTFMLEGKLGRSFIPRLQLVVLKEGE